MAKALALTPETMAAPQLTPKAATPARGVEVSSTTSKTAINKPDQVPLQVRIPRHHARAIKIAAAQNDQTISEFMLACFHAYMKEGKHA